MPRPLHTRHAASTLLAVAVLAAGCTSPSTPAAGPTPSAVPTASTDASGRTVLLASTRTPAQALTVVADATAAARAASAATALFEAAPVVVLTADDPAALAAAGRIAVVRGLPLLVAGPEAASALDQLGTTRAVVVGTGVTLPDGITALPLADVPDLATRGGTDAPLPSDLLGTTVGTATRSGDLVLAPGRAVPDVVVLARPDDAASYAATATARAARATVVLAADPRAGDAPAALAGHGEDPLLVLGDALPSDPETARYLVAAAAGPGIPGGGHLVLDRRYVALYGHPGAATLGVLGEQDVPATIRRAQQVAGAYDGLTDPAVTPTLEIIATVASGSPGSDGDYSNEASPETLTPMIDAAGAAGMYVLLDLQPGRSDLLSQAKLYAPLLERPYVGLALDPEWRLRANEVPLRQIGSVSIEEVNSVVTWLADLTRSKALPQKLLLLHQFRLSMIRDRDRLDTSRPELQIMIQMDGQGGQGVKLSTWEAIRRGAPEGVVFGWKNFYDEDSPTLSPALTAKLTPVPWFVSYQ